MKAQQWNDKYPVGQAIALTEDDKSTTFTQTKTPAWELGDGNGYGDGH